MAANTTIAINDGASTPVSHVFQPDGVTGTEANYREVTAASGIEIGQPKLKLAHRKPVAGSAYFKETLEITFPVLEVTSPSTATGIQPAPTQAYADRITVTAFTSNRDTEQNRKDLLALAANALNNALVKSVFIDRQVPY